MTDSKVNMSLDDIIKLNKKNKPTFPKKGAQQRGGARAGRGGARGAAVTARAGNKGGSPRKGGLARAKGAVVNKAGLRKGAAVNQQTKKLVSQLVKKALKNRLGGSLAARRATAVANAGAVRVGRAGLGLGRVAARSRVIGRNRITAPVQVVPTVVKRQRARGIRPVYQNQIVRPVIVQKQRARPVVVERVIQAPRQRVIQRVVQRPRQQRVIVQQQPIRQRVIQRPQQQRVIVVERQAPTQRVQKVIRVQQQRPQFVRQQRQPVQYAQTQSRKNNAFRNALGLGSPNRRIQTVQRFEPPQFVANVRRGRGFQNF